VRERDTKPASQFVYARYVNQRPPSRGDIIPCQGVNRHNLWQPTAFTYKCYAHFFIWWPLRSGGGLRLGYDL